MSEYEVTSKNRVRRIRENAVYDTEGVHGVLDAGLVCHVGFVQDGQPFVIPMIYAREGGVIYLLVSRSGSEVHLRNMRVTPICNFRFAILDRRNLFLKIMNCEFWGSRGPTGANGESK